MFFTTRKRSLGQGNIFSSVCQGFCTWGGGVCLSACWDTTPRPGRHPPSPEQSMLGDTVNERAVCILLECNLVICYFCFKVTTLHYVRLPMIMGQQLVKTSISVGHGMRYHKIKLIFSPLNLLNSCSAGQSQLSTSITSVIDQVASVRVLPWWDPKYPYNSSMQNSHWLSFIEGFIIFMDVSQHLCQVLVAEISCVINGNSLVVTNNI